MNISPLLDIKNVSAGYNYSHIISNISFSIFPGEAVGLLGRNGVGKTTTILSILRQTKWKTGEIHFRGIDITNLQTHLISRMGIGVVPEGRRIFPTLTVKENLMAFKPSKNYRNHYKLKDILEIFPQLGLRINVLGRFLSGGEQQMVSIGRALMSCPHLLILDEATEGLAASLKNQIWQCLYELKKSGLAVLIVDRFTPELLNLTDKNIILEKGEKIWSGTSSELKKNKNIKY